MFDVERIKELVAEAAGVLPGVGVELREHEVGLRFTPSNWNRFEEKVRIEAIRRLPWHTAWHEPPHHFIDAEYEVL